MNVVRSDVIVCLLLLSVLSGTAGCSGPSRGSESGGDVEQDRGDQDVIADFSVPRPELPAPVENSSWGECPRGWESTEITVASETYSVQYCHPGMPVAAETEEGCEATVSLQKMVDAADDGEVISLPPGRYAGPVVLDDGRTVTISGDRRDAVSICPPDVDTPVIMVCDGTLNLKSVTVRGGVTGIRVEQSGCVSLRDVIVRKTRNAGVFVSGTGSASFERVVVSDTVGNAAGSGGKGLVITDKAHVTVENFVVDNTMHGGVQLCEPYTDCTAVLEGSYLTVRGTRPKALDGHMGYGVAISSGGEMALSHVLIQKNTTFGIGVFGPSGEQGKRSSIKIDHAVVRETASQADDGMFGWGMYAEGATDVMVAATIVSQNTTCGILLAGPSGSAPTFRGVDMIIHDTQSQPSDGEYGEGVVILDGTEAEFMRTHIENNRSFGMLVSFRGAFAGPRLRGEDIVVRDIRPRDSDGSGGFGVGIFDRTSVTFHRLRVENTCTAGFIASPAEGGEAVDLTGSDIFIGSSGARSSDGAYGMGLALQDSVSADITGLHIVDAATAGIFLYGGVSLSLSGAVVSSRAVGIGGCDIDRSGPGGRCGLALYQGAILHFDKILTTCNDIGVDLSAARFHANETCGADGAVCAEIRNNITGMNYWDLSSSYDISRNLREVRFRDNDIPLTTDTRTVPDPVTAGERRQ